MMVADVRGGGVHDEFYGQRLSFLTKMFSWRPETIEIKASFSRDVLGTNNETVSAMLGHVICQQIIINYTNHFPINYYDCN